MRILIWIDKLSNHLQIDIVNITPSQEGSPLRPLNDSEEVVHDLSDQRIRIHMDRQIVKHTLICF